MEMLAALLLALQADAPAAAETIRKTREEKSFEILFEAAAGLAGEKFSRKGKGQRCAPGILLLDVEAVGRKRTRAIRVGEAAWVYGEVPKAWLAHDDSDDRGVAHGAMNPDVLLSLLAKHAGAAKAKGTELEIRLEGAEAVALANLVVPNQDWNRAQAIVRIASDGAGRLASVRIEGTAGNAAGAGNLNATLTFARYGAVALPEGLGGAKFDKTILAALDRHLGR